MTPQPPGWLFHAEGQGSFANSTGSVSGFQYTGVAQTAMRKGLVTNQTFFSFNVQEQRLEDNGGSFKQTAITHFTDMLLININKPLNLVTAVIWDKDEPKAVLHRAAIFEGACPQLQSGEAARARSVGCHRVRRTNMISRPR